MILNKKVYAASTSENVDALFALPEKVVQFGTGVLLRGLPDYFIDKANKQGLFNGRIVVVKSTDQGGTDAYEIQDGLYTILEKGIENGSSIERTTINASISRVVPAADLQFIASGRRAFCKPVKVSCKGCWRYQKCEC